MKVIHTSDLHIGKVLYGEELTENHLAFFVQLLRLVQEEKPDALLVSGDIYETSNISVSSKRLFNDAMLRIHEALPSMTIVVISGNHDSAQRIGVDEELWRLANVRIVTSIAETDDRKPDFDSHIIELKDAHGRTCGWLGAVPFAYEQNFPKPMAGMNRIASFYKGLLQRMAQRNGAGLPLLLMGHLTVAGNLDFSGHKLDSIGGVETLPIADFSDEFDYFALGHIHHPQFVGGLERKVRYSGSPIAVSFDEDFDHSVSVVTFDEENRPHVREHRIEVPHRLVTVPSEPADFVEALRAMRSYPWEGTEYVRLNVKQETAPSDAYERAARELNEDSPLVSNRKKADESYFQNLKLLTVNYVRSKARSEATSLTDVSLSEFRALTPLEVAKRSLGDDFSEEMEETFNEVLRMMEE